jgi:hypothetical protein
VFQAKIAKKIKTRILCSGGQATDDSKKQRMRSACWIPQSIVTHSGYVIFITFSTATVVPRTRLTVTCTAGLFEMSAAQHIVHYREVTAVYTAVCVYFVTGQVLQCKPEAASAVLGS